MILELSEPNLLTPQLAWAGRSFVGGECTGTQCLIGYYLNVISQCMKEFQHFLIQKKALEI